MIKNYYDGIEVPVPTITRSFLQELLDQIRDEDCVAGVLYVGWRTARDFVSFDRTEVGQPDISNSPVIQFSVMGIPAVAIRGLHDYFHLTYEAAPFRKQKLDNLMTKLKEVTHRSGKRFATNMRLRSGLQAIREFTKVAGAEHLSEEAAKTLRSIVGGAM